MLLLYSLAILNTCDDDDDDDEQEFRILSYFLKIMLCLFNASNKSDNRYLAGLPLHVCFFAHRPCCVN